MFRANRPRAIVQKDDSPGQKLFLLEDSQLWEPPYKRTEIRDPSLTGISPREGFKNSVNKLLAAGFPERTIDEQLVHCIETERWWIKVMLSDMQTGAVRVINEAQRDNAVTFRNALDDLTNLETAWWYFELNTTKMLKKNPTIAKRWQINSNIIRCELGRFRENIVMRSVELLGQELRRVA